MKLRTLRNLSPVVLAVVMLVVVAARADAMDGRNPDGRTGNAKGEITAQYWHGLNRDPDATGLASYLKFAGENCRWGVQDATFKILNSAEAHRAWRDDPRTLAGMLYAALLNRPADAGGLGAYTTAIRDRGLPWATAQMMGSVEYRTRLARFCPSASETATEYDWQSAQALAKDAFLKRAADLAISCGFTTAIRTGLAQLQKTPNPYLMSVGLIAEVTAKLEGLAGLDGTCGAAVTFMRAYLEVGRTVDGERYNPVFIQWSVGNKGWNGQRAFTVRVGPNPTEWKGFSGKAW